MPETWQYFPQGLSETLEFETDVRQAPGGEWRDSLKDATQFFNTFHVMGAAKAEAALERVRLNSFGDWYFPDWANQTRVLSTLASTTTVLNVANTDAYVVGQKVLVALDDDTWEQREVASKGVGTVTLTSGLVGSYGGNAVRPAVIVPLVLCIAPNGAEFQAYFGANDINMTFMSMEPQDLSGNAYPLYLGLPVVTDGAVLFSPLAGTVSQAIDLTQSKFGAYEQQEAELYVRRRGSVSWFDKGVSAMWTRRQFLHFLRGRDGEFWLPTGRNDMKLSAAIDAADLSISVKGVLSDALVVDKHIVVHENGNTVCKQVAAALTTGGVQELEITATGVDFSANATVSFVTKSRLDTDSMEVVYSFVAGGLASTCAVATIEVL